MTSDQVLRAVLDELAAPAHREHPDWGDILRRSGVRDAEPRPTVTRARGRREGRRILVVVALAFLAAVVVGVALAATGILQGSPAPPENDAALRQLMPPLGIGPATELAAHGGRTLFGARTKGGGYCFSATSPTDPKGEGGHCLSKADEATLDDRGVVAFALSGSSAGGYAPGAESVRITGAGIDAEYPVSNSGWWVGEARLPSPPLPPGIERATVVATARTGDGAIVGRDPLLLVQHVAGPAGGVYQIAFI